VKKVAALALAVIGAVAAGIAPTSAASNAWFRWPGTPPIKLTVRVPQPELQPSFQRAVAAWGLSPAYKLTLVSQTQCPAVRQISVCNDPAGVETLDNPAATSPTMVNGQGISATIWVHDPWLAGASTEELDYMACHELGHALGLAHQAVYDSCMSYAFARPFPNAQDYRSLGELYGLPPSTDPKVDAAAPAPAQAAAPAPAPATPSSQICAPAASTATGPAPDVLSYGDAGFHGSTGGVALTLPIAGMAATRSGAGYWTVATDGGIFAFGDARFLGSTGNIRLNRPIVGMAATRSGNGYWMVASDGGIFAFGDARFLGSTGNIRLNKPIVAMAPTPTGQGYWLVASDGGIFAFGDARFLGSTGNIRLNRPVVAMASTASGHGYWMFASDGGIFTYGDAAFLGSGASLDLGGSVAGVAVSAGGQGYWIAGTGGRVAVFGDARCFGSIPSLDTGRSQVQSIVATPSGGGYWLATRRVTF
jgi:matrixin